MKDVFNMVKDLYYLEAGAPIELAPGQLEIFNAISKKIQPRLQIKAFTRYGKSLTAGLAVLTRVCSFPEKWKIVAGTKEKAKIIMSYVNQHIFDNEYTASKFVFDRGETKEYIRRHRNKNHLTFRIGKSPDGKDLYSDLMILAANDALGEGAPNVVEDEASLIDDTPHSFVMRMLGDNPQNNFLCKLGNPFKRNHFLKSELDPAYKKINIDCYRGLTEGRITEATIEENRPYIYFPILYENKFPGASEIDEKGWLNLLTDDDILVALERKVEPFGVRKLGVDVARGGRNFNVWVLRDNNTAKVLLKNHDNDLMSVAKTTMDFMKSEHVLAEETFIDDSVMGDVPVIIRRHKKFIDIIPICSLHKKDNLIYKKGFGDMEILSGSGWTKILYSRRHKVKKTGYDIIVGNGRTMVTQDHSIMQNGVEVKPDELEVGDYVDIYKPEWINSFDSDKELAWFLGLFIAEGSVKLNKKYNSHQTQISNLDNKLLNRSARVAEERFCSTHSILKDRTIIYSRTFADYLLDCCYSINKIRGWEKGKHVTKKVKIKKIPIHILNGSREIKESFLKGYLAGDGFVNEREEKSDSKELTISAGIQYLYNSLGIETSVRVRKDKLNISTIARLNGTKRGIGEAKIKNIRKFKIDDFVYDLETKSHTFVAGLGYIVHHNTGVGGGVVDRCREAGAKVNGVQLGAGSDEDDMLNVRAELYAGRNGVHNWIKRTGHLEPHKDWEELTRIRYKKKISGTIIESKDDMRKRGEESPDVADALILSFSKPKRVIYKGLPDVKQILGAGGTNPAGGAGELIPGVG